MPIYDIYIFFIIVIYLDVLFIFNEMTLKFLPLASPHKIPLQDEMEFDELISMFEIAISFINTCKNMT